MASPYLLTAELTVEEKLGYIQGKQEKNKRTRNETWKSVQAKESGWDIGIKCRLEMGNKHYYYM